MVKGRATGKWSFPKGHKFRNEGYQECARRETLEETGVDLSPYKPVAYHKLSHGEYYFYELPSEITPAAGDVEEVEDVRWMSLADIKRERVNVDVNYFLDRLRRGGGRPVAAVDTRPEDSDPTCAVAS
jgi:8-oxo-dGTP pyrophosphatase MutT (NUDIX family)